MNRKLFFIFLVLSASELAFTPCVKNDLNTQHMNFIDSATLRMAIDSVRKTFPMADVTDISDGVGQAAEFWWETDGTKDEFVAFCKDNFLSTPEERKIALEKISRDIEILNGYFNKISVGLKEPLHMNTGPVTAIDQMYGGYDPSSHLVEDCFKNKIAFYILLNFKFHSLSDKTVHAASWNRLQWAMVRLGQYIDSRVPGELLLKYSDVNTRAESYISEYNIYMGNLVNSKNEKLFPAGMKLISHWGLRDELKADYNTKNGLEKQQLIYGVMNRIIQQDIPSEVINSAKYQWNPLTNQVFDNGRVVGFSPEPDTRYEWLLRSFKALQEMDAYNPFFPTYIQAKFEREMEIPQQDVEDLFKELLTSPEVKRVALLIRKRLKRELEPFDIWYDGFKSRSSVDFSELDKMVQKKYPNSEAFEADIPNILVKLGFTDEKARYIASKIQVDAARGSGHAWGAAMKGDKARLRTRIPESGMDYKGFNIAMHELGHCVEETLTLYDIDYYLLNGIPNTAFTEALAFVFQKRDLAVLGIPGNQNDKYDQMALDIFWSNYEIMGVSLVDMNVWKWLYQHKDATKAQLKEAVIRIAKEVWNQYYAGVFGVKDQIILAIYSHMIDYPLYLAAYPIGYLIDFQIEKQIQGKNFGEEIMRIYGKGKIIPQQWMKDAVGHELSNKPLLEAVDKALEKN